MTTVPQEPAAELSAAHGPGRRDQMFAPNPGIEPRSSALQADILTSEPPGKPGIQMLNATK